MVKMHVSYTGELHCELTHGPSGIRIQTDAPKDNKGRGEAFSPSDLVGAALASCILTTMAIVAERDGLDFTTAEADVEKIMADKPHRRIEQLNVNIRLPASYTPEQRQKLERVATHCPVHRSLSPEMKIPVNFLYI